MTVPWTPAQILPKAFSGFYDVYQASVRWHEVHAGIEWALVYLASLCQLVLDFALTLNEKFSSLIWLDSNLHAEGTWSMGCLLAVDEVKMETYRGRETDRISHSQKDVTMMQTFIEARVKTWAPWSSRLVVAWKKASHSSSEVFMLSLRSVYRWEIVRDSWYGILWQSLWGTCCVDFEYSTPGLPWDFYPTESSSSALLALPWFEYFLAV